MTEYAGSDWIEKSLKVGEMSPLGRAVANLLGEWQAGIYHLNTRALRRVEWNNTHHIVFNLSWRTMSTFDDCLLTRLVFLAHHMAIRVEIQPCNMQSIRLLFHQRNRDGDFYHVHPTLQDAVDNFHAAVSLEEVK